jgi:hypothetical protein
LAPLLPRLQLLTLSRMELMTASQFMFKVRGRRRLALLLSPIYHSIPPVLGRAFVCVRVCVCVCVFIYACLVMLHECAFSCLTLLYILFLVTQTQLVFWFLVVAFALLVKASLFLRNNLFYNQEAYLKSSVIVEAVRVAAIRRCRAEDQGWRQSGSSMTSSCELVPVLGIHCYSTYRSSSGLRPPRLPYTPALCNM